jgi:hypothetical protein
MEIAALKFTSHSRFLRTGFAYRAPELITEHSLPGTADVHHIVCYNQPVIQKMVAEDRPKYSSRSAW